MRFSIVAILATLLSVALADQAYPTAPVASTKWKAGATVTIKWTLTPPAATTGLKIELLTGDNPQSQRVVATLGTGAPGATKFAATLPADLKSGYYSVRIGDSYSSYFLIQGEGAVPTGPLPTAKTTTIATATTLTSTTASGRPSSSIAPLPVITTPSGGAKPIPSAGSGSGASFLKASVVAPVAAAAAAVVMAVAF